MDERGGGGMKIEGGRAGLAKAVRGNEGSGIGTNGRGKEREEERGSG